MFTTLPATGSRTTLRCLQHYLPRDLVLGGVVASYNVLVDRTATGTGKSALFGAYILARRPVRLYRLRLAVFAMVTSVAVVWLGRSWQ